MKVGRVYILTNPDSEALLSGEFRGGLQSTYDGTTNEEVGVFRLADGQTYWPTSLTEKATPTVELVYWRARALGGI